MSFKLSKQLALNSSDVRCLAISKDGQSFYSGSRDNSISLLKASGEVVWRRDASAWVCSLSAIEGGIYCGIRDGSILQISESGDMQNLVQAKNNSYYVACISTFPNNDASFMYGSWSQDATLFPSLKRRQLNTPVWAVCVLSDEQALVSNNSEVLLVSLPSLETKKSYKCHSALVRSIQLLPSASPFNIGRSKCFVSASNDGTLCVTSLDTSETSVMTGHESYIYHLHADESSIVSCSEDMSVRVWTQDGTQVISHPCTVWSVLRLSNGDVVTAGSDGFTRIFSTDKARIATDQEIQDYNKLIQASKKIDEKDIKDKSVLDSPGSKDGEIVMVRNEEGVVGAWKWSQAENWTYLGEVTQQAPTRPTLDGKQFDFVFDVNIADDAPPLKLGVNASDDFYAVAQEFISSNNLPASYVEQVVDFIKKNMGSTGNMASASAQSQYVDPYTGAGRYVAAETHSVPAKSEPSSSVLPIRTALDFKACNGSGLLSKLKEIRGTEKNSSSIDSSDFAKIIDFVASYGLGMRDTDEDLCKLSSNAFAASLEIMKHLNLTDRIPFLDVIRCSAFGPLDSDLLTSTSCLSLFDMCLWNQQWPSPSSPEFKARDTTTMLLLRFLSNLASSSAGKTCLITIFPQIMSQLRSASVHSFGKNTQIALATTLFNTNELGSNSGEMNGASFLMKTILELTENPEARYRAIVAIGNLLSSSSSSKLDTEVVAMLKHCAFECGVEDNEKRTRDVCLEISMLD